MWMEIMTGDLDVSTEMLWEAYEENLDYVLEHVYELVPELTGKTIVTSDHGNMVGERSYPIPIREWGHPPMTYTTELVKVPWFIIEDETRKEITAEQPSTDTRGADEDLVQDRLEDLGYV
jgi:bisphosphoglycerate-independent phosphoglycerate mutase (AlkP superfamily)